MRDAHRAPASSAWPGAGRRGAGRGGEGPRGAGRGREGAGPGQGRAGKGRARSWSAGRSRISDHLGDLSSPSCVPAARVSMEERCPASAGRSGEGDPPGPEEGTAVEGEQVSEGIPLALGFDCIFS